MRLKTFYFGAWSAASLLVAAAPIYAETVNCTAITAVPYTITTPGVYCVTQKITSNLASGAAITINANNVVLDLNGFAIGNIAAGPATGAAGIYAVDRQNIRLRNGIVRGFNFGVALLDGTSVGLTTANSSGHIVEGITADHCYAVGIAVQGPYSTVKFSSVYATTGSANSSTAGGAASGISVDNAPGGIVRNNQVFDTDCSNGCTVGTGIAAGIEIGSSPSSQVSGNTVTNSTLPTVANSVAIAVDMTTTNIFVQGNVLANWNTGITFGSLSSGKYHGNGFIGGITTNVQGTTGVNAGGNY